ncbi:uncharacterized protein ColSpa_06048 [Colletotrichum spaethianum]|uniref:Uncharacterized protein n=1 Tax=Colletotrichum spaethianum TaxID=700344 RepID=A0AA37LKC4_9PEZI|nr:uncharacterized protein ColSpa_06048 [Colletotrichum spaethianum]GKT45867.1 hypothetical protein ColSpa_06048 [Colletotrichum spaethianum]
MRLAPTQVVATAFIFSLGTFVAGNRAAMAEGKRNITRPDPAIPLAPVPLPPPGPARDGEEIVRQLMGLTRSGISGGGGPGSGSWLRFVKRVELKGDLWEPEGIVRLAGGSGGAGDEEERFWVSAGEYTVPTEKFPGGKWVDGTDRSAGAGFAHLVYHNGGLDYDGRHIWATLSQYRPNTTGTVVRIDPVELTVEKVFRVSDHQGGIVHDVETGTLTTLNWGGRMARRWILGKGAGPEVRARGNEQVRLGGATEGGDAGSEAFDAPEKEIVNPSYWIDYQDCKSLGRVDGRSLMLCSGIATLAAGVEVGGLAIVDAEGMVPIWEVPFMERTGARSGERGEGGSGVLMTKNPMDVALVGGRVRLYFAPEEGRSAVFVYEVCEG